jgi:hypothetical protein
MDKKLCILTLEDGTQQNGYWLGEGFSFYDPRRWRDENHQPITKNIVKVEELVTQSVNKEGK